jgi:hypothetical protein
VKRLVISSTIAALVAGGAGFAFADGGPSLNGNNNFGLCTAYEAQSAHNPNGPSAPFQQLADDYANSNNGASFSDYCNALLNDGTPGNSTGGHTNHGGGH